MTCDFPLKAYKSSVVNPSGKRSMQFTAHGSHTGVGYLLGCGKCTGCRLDYSRQWGVRCVHESKMHSQNMFLTLTYDDDHLPKFGTLRPRDLQLFHKRLHNRLLDERGLGIRYYACGEYGSLSQRPHYHSLIFGYRFPDLKLYSESKYGSLYSSKLLDSLWYDSDGSPFGSCKIGDVTLESACYVARYCLKKVDGAKRDAGHYIVYDSDGEIFERVPEFSHMSRRPGIGATYFAKYGSEIAQHDSIIMNGKQVPSIRYYDKRVDKMPMQGKGLFLDKSRLDEVRRIRNRNSVWSERHDPDRLRAKRVIRDAGLKQKGRKL